MQRNGYAKKSGDSNQKFQNSFFKTQKHGSAKAMNSGLRKAEKESMEYRAKQQPPDFFNQNSSVAALALQSMVLGGALGNQ